MSITRALTGIAAAALFCVAGGVLAAPEYAKVGTFGVGAERVEVRARGGSYQETEVGKNMILMAEFQLIEKGMATSYRYGIAADACAAGEGTIHAVEVGHGKPVRELYVIRGDQTLGGSVADVLCLIHAGRAAARVAQ